MDNFFGNNGKKISWVQISFLLCALTLTFSVFALLSGDSTVVYSSANLIAIPLFITGVADSVIAATKKRTLKGSLWLVFDGLSTISLSVFLIISTPFALYLLPLCFGVWEIVLGIFKICESRQLKKENIKNHAGFLVTGAAEIISGVCFLIRPVDEAVGYNVAVAITLIIQISAYALRYYLYSEMSEEI